MRHVPRGFIIKMHWRVGPVHKLSRPIIDPAGRWMGDGIYVEHSLLAPFQGNLGNAK